ncbi:MAG TPA: fused MFS/spermidine synthase, partial [Cellvibrionaceae bacterium]|nr:fused MFS/spermidine synthase [Cellvibrionaceae bacterium]
MRYLVFASAFVAGFVVMVLEMLGGRIIAPWFGGDIYVWGSIITVFMLALSLGYLIGGRWSLHNASLRRYGLIFLGAGLLILPVVFIAQPIMAAIFDRIVDARYGSLAASLLLFLLPSIVMGMVSPYSVRLLTQSRESSGASAGVLYFVST